MKKPMNQLSMITLLFSLVLGLTACGKASENKKETTPEGSGDSTDMKATTPTDTKETDHKTRSCTALFLRMETCSKELGEKDNPLDAVLKSGQDAFVAECLKQYEDAQKMFKCVDEATCGKFFKCAFHVDLVEMKKLEEAEKKGEQP